jgi:HK97 family phage major capsid protein
MSAIQPLLDELKKVSDRTESLSKQVEELKKPQDDAARRVPFARRGESALTSRGYSFSKLFGVLGKRLGGEDAKVEIDVSNRLQKLYSDLGVKKAELNSILAPAASSHIAQMGDETFGQEVGDLVKAGVTGYDREEVMRIRKQYWGVQKALSWLDESVGGTLVAPPLQGELIDLLRNNEVFMQAGAKTIAMPPNGRIVFPRQTTPSEAYWVGESATINDSTPGTGDVTLTAKKLAVLVKMPNELFRFSSVSVEQFVRDDLARVMSLKMDKSFLEAPGSSNEPKGLINYAGILSHTAMTVGANGNTFEPEDVNVFIAKIEERNAQFKTWIMRPLMYAALTNRRSDAVSAGDKKGLFLFNMLRELNSGHDLDRLGVGSLSGYPVLKSTQVSNARSKGNASNLSYILGGDFTDYVIAMSGVIEFMLSQQGDTPFTQDQTWIRGIQLVDGAPRREASFGWIDELVVA